MRFDFAALKAVHELIEDQPQYFYMNDWSRSRRLAQEGWLVDHDLDFDVAADEGLLAYVDLFKEDNACGTACCIAGWLYGNRIGAKPGESFVFDSSPYNEAAAVTDSMDLQDRLDGLFHLHPSETYPARAVLRWLVEGGEDEVVRRLEALPLHIDNLGYFEEELEADFFQPFDSYYQEVLPVFEGYLSEEF